VRLASKTLRCVIVRAKIVDSLAPYGVDKPLNGWIYA
jgi:hypothetical protein